MTTLCMYVHNSSVKYSQRQDELYDLLDNGMVSQSRCAVGFMTTYEVREFISGVCEETVVHLSYCQY